MPPQPAYARGTRLIVISHGDVIANPRVSPCPLGGRRCSTRLAMGFGWQEMQTATGKTNLRPRSRRSGVADRPTFDFEQEAACKRLQSCYRAMMGRRNFRKLIEV